jgi:hypothetical protein
MKRLRWLGTLATLGLLACGGSYRSEVIPAWASDSASAYDAANPLAGVAPEDYVDMYARLPACDLPEAPEDWPVRAWSIEPLAGTLRLPPGYEPWVDTTVTHGGPPGLQWRAPGTGRVELTGLAGMGGLAAAGGGRLVVVQDPCRVELLGHRAPIAFMAFVRPEGDTIFFTLVNTVVRTGAGFQAILHAQTREARQAQLAMVHSVTLSGAAKSGR